MFDIKFTPLYRLIFRQEGGGQRPRMTKCELGRGYKNIDF